MLPVGNKPVIQYVIEWILQAGIENIIVITSQWKHSIEDYFDKSFELEELLKQKWKHELLDQINHTKYLGNLCFVKQKEQLWFAHAIMQTSPWMSDDEYFLLTLGDEIHHPCIYQEILALHQQTGKPVLALQTCPLEEIYKYGVAEVKDGRVMDLVEKPSVEQAPSNLRIIGDYILPSRIFDIIRSLPLNKRGEIDIVDAMKIIMEGEEILAYITEYPTRDIWTTESWLKANNDIVGDPLLLQ